MSEYRGRSSRGGRGNYSGNGNDNDGRVVQFNTSYRGRGGGYKSKNRVKRNVGSFRPRSDGARLDDDDVSMEGNNPRSNYSYQRNRQTPYEPRGRGSRRSRGRGRGGSGAAMRMGANAAMDQREGGALQRLGVPVNRGGRGDMFSKSGWFEILIPYGADHGKTFVLDGLKSTCPEPFNPVQPFTRGRDFLFFVDDPSAAKSLRSVSRKVTAQSGVRLMVIVKPSNGPQNAPVKPEVIKQVTVALSNRYQPTTQVLDLSDLYNDTGLRQQDVVFSANKPVNIQAILDIIGEHIPELTGLDLSKNRLRYLSAWESLADKAPNMKALNLADNEIKNDSELSQIKRLKNLVELNLKGNPLCDKFDDRSKYISAVRKILPKIIKLDDYDLPPPITFEVDSQQDQLPPTLGSNFPDPRVQTLVGHFLKQYFDIFDSDSRQGLLAAYHDNAVYSMSVCYNGMLKGQPGFEYLTESRNVIRLDRNNDRRQEKLQKMLKHGKINVVAALAEFPKTQHDFSSLVVDVSLANAQIMQFVVTGVFREASSRGTDPIRTFSRTFITQHVGDGILIVNEMFTITNATEEQIKKSFKTPDPTPTPSPQGDVVTTAPDGAAAAVPTPQQKQMMVTEFAQKSGMNMEFSMKCLEECAWDFDRAAKAFVMVKEKGQIPPEAFVK